MAHVSHNLTAVLLCLETAHGRNCLFDGAEEVFEALAESEGGCGEDCLTMVQQSKMQDVSNKVSEKNGVLTTMNVQFPVQAHPGRINKLCLALPSGKLPRIIEECLPFDAVVVVRSEQGGIVLQSL